MDCRDLRPLFEPIDYVAFNSLASGNGRIDSILFLDEKAGGSQLTPAQRQIKDVVERGKVDWAAYKGRLRGLRLSPRFRISSASQWSARGVAASID